MLLRRLVRHRWGAATLLCALGLVAAASLVGSSMLAQSSERALAESVLADQGGFEFALQAGTRAAARASSTTDDLHPVADGEGSVSVDDASSRSRIRTARDDGTALTTVVAGRGPSADGEAAVSERLAHVLSVGVGDTVVVRDASGGERPVRVVGLSRDPARADDLHVVQVDADLASARATVWLTDIDPYSVAALVPFLDERTLGYRTAESLTEDRVAAVPGVVEKLPWALAALWAVVAMVAVALLAPVARDDADALLRAGAAPVDAWRLIRRAALGCVLVGQVAGTVVVIASIAVWRSELSGLLGQAWISVDVAWSVLVLVPACTVLAAFLAPASAGRARRGAGRLLAAQVLGRGALVLAGLAGAAIWLAAGWASLPQPAHRFASYAPYGVGLMALAVPGALAWLACRQLPPATAAVARRLVTPLATLTAAAAVLASTSGGYAAREVHDANVNEARSGSLQPPGSFLAHEVPASAVPALTQEFRRLGGRQVETYLLPDESAEQVRVTGEALVGCMAADETTDPNSVEDSCWPQETFSPINTVALTEEDGACCVADPGLVEDGRIGLLTFSSRRGDVIATQVAEAQPNSALGGNMPGLVLPARGPLATALGMTPTQYRLLAFLDFTSLDERAQAQLRGSISRLAPGAQTLDAAEAAPYEARRSVAAAVAVAGSLLVLLLLVLGGLVLAAGQRSVLRTVADLGGDARRRVSLVGRLIAVPVGSTAVVGLLTWATTGVAGIQAEAPSGALWTLPFVAASAGSVVVGSALLRLPARTAD